MVKAADSELPRNEELRSGEDDDGSLVPSDVDVPAKDMVGDTAKMLASRQLEDITHDDPFDSESDEGSADLENEKALAEIQFAATRRKDLDKQKLREARQVEPVFGKESIHALPASEDVSQRDMMWRMLRALGKDDNGEKGSGKAALEKKVKRVHANGKDALAVPLPDPVQGRIERAAAYGDVKDSLTRKWGKVVQKNRKAKHLVFPLNGPGKTVSGNTGSMAESFKAEANYEGEIEALLKEAGVASDLQVIQQEESGADELGNSGLTKDDVMKRRRELAKIRSLMFHYEHKMKRIKKIKSKKYRRVMKKEKEKLAQVMGEYDDVETAARKAERARVEERMTLRHKNTSKWVRRQLQRKEGQRDPNVRAAIGDQLQLHEELRKRQESEQQNSDSSEDEGTGNESDGEAVEEEEQNLVNKLGRNVSNHKRKGLLGMRFMQEAQERKRKKALALLESMDDEGLEEGDNHDLRSLGRQKFSGPRSTEDDESPPRQRGQDEDEEELVSPKRQTTAVAKDDSPILNSSPPTLKDREESNRPSTVLRGFTTKLDGRLTADENPWLSVAAIPAADSETALASGTKVGSRAGERQKAEKKRPRSPEITVLERPARWQAEVAPRTAKPVAPEAPADMHSEEGTGRAPRVAAVGKSKKVTWAQSDELARMEDIAEAFAGAGGAERADFEAAKESEIERSVPSARSLQAEVLPGWGTWDGAGISQAKRRKAETPFAKAARERLEAARAAAVNGRGDKSLRHVILDERRIKQTTDLTLSSVPFPFTSREQWEREVDTPVSKERLTSAAFTEGVRKRVVAKPGTIIEPIRHTEPDEHIHRGKRGIIELRKQRSVKRSKARRGLMA